MLYIIPLKKEPWVLNHSHLPIMLWTFAQLLGITQSSTRSCRSHAGRHPPLLFLWDLRVLYNDWARRDGCTGWAVRIQVTEAVTGSKFSTPRLGLLQDILCLLLLTLPLYLDPFPLTYLHSVCGTGFCCGTVTKQTLPNCYKSLFLFLVLLGCLPSFKDFFMIISIHSCSFWISSSKHSGISFSPSLNLP